MNSDTLETAIFAGGCFWCTEAVFLAIKGVVSVHSGYIGGKSVNPTYEEVCSGISGHAEAVKIVFDPKIITYQTLLEVFFATHDPTTLNRQGADIGTQYRSEIFSTNAFQSDLAKVYINLLNGEGGDENKIVTKVSEAVTFYAAEIYHQNYYNRNKAQSYCHFVISPKMEKLKYLFEMYLKDKIS